LILTRFSSIWLFTLFIPTHAPDRADRAGASIVLIDFLAPHAGQLGLRGQCAHGGSSAGLIASLAHPGRNVTGTSFLGPDLAAKRLQLLKQVIPSAVRVALLFNPNNASNRIFRDEIETAARDLGISLVQVEASSVSDLNTNLRGILSHRPDALIATADSFLFLQVRQINDFLESNGIPGMFSARDYVLAGGLMSYGPSIPDLFRRSARYVQKILQGTKPSDLPVEQPTKFEFVINLTSAKAVGLTIPASILSLADDLIE
jgi:putative ABC transport system substrate-binding protein